MQLNKFDSNYYHVHIAADPKSGGNGMLAATAAC
jgi:hypothetical protein